MPNPVEQLKEEYDTVARHLEDAKLISQLSDFNKNFRKVLLLAAGSYFEHKVTGVLTDFAKAKSNNDERLINFLQKQAISQRYHTLFSWGQKDNPNSHGTNANTFFSLFGENFSTQLKAELKHKQDETPEQSKQINSINQSVNAFIQIGHLRNILVHSNFAAYDYEEKTTDEIFSLFKEAEPFVDFISLKLT